MASGISLPDRAAIHDQVTAPVTPPVVLTDSKSPFLSKMNLFNALVFVLGVLEFLGQVSILGLFIQDETTRQRVAAILLTVVVPLINMVLRSFFTYRPTTLAVVPDTAQKPPQYVTKGR